jgi:alkyl hydroperoxide reductase subunit F
MQDLIILGGGPAGCAAAVYAARKRLNTTLIAAEWGGQSNVSEDIQNWIGTPHLPGAQLSENLKAHVYEYKGDVLSILEGEKANSIEKIDGGFKVTTETGKSAEAKTVLIATGSGRRKLPVLGADKFENKGLTYCASCDGPLFAGQDVIVVGGGNAAFESAAQLLAYCKKVTILNRGDSFKADEVTVEKLSKDPKLTIIKNVEMLEVLGDKFVSGMKIKRQGAEEEILNASGIFVEIGQIPNTGFVDTFLPLDAHKKIIVDPMTQRTSIEGIWAAGDATNGLYHQNNIAMGDAVKALEDIYLFLRA